LVDAGVNQVVSNGSVQAFGRKIAVAKMAFSSNEMALMGEICFSTKHLSVLREVTFPSWKMVMCKMTLSPEESSVRKTGPSEMGITVESGITAKSGITTKIGIAVNIDIASKTVFTPKFIRKASVFHSFRVTRQA
jgi:hypothetical protein